jgi:hypothetical protein
MTAVLRIIALSRTLPSIGHDILAFRRDVEGHMVVGVIETTQGNLRKPVLVEIEHFVACVVADDGYGVGTVTLRSVGIDKRSMGVDLVCNIVIEPYPSVLVVIEIIAQGIVGIRLPRHFHI